MMERQLELHIQREREITELTIANAGWQQEISKQKADIAVLESQRRLTAPDHCLLTGIDNQQIGNWIARRSYELSRLPRFSFRWLFLMDFCRFLLFKRFFGL
jgi:hypothetical protein